jgi:hypothetical protein
MAVHHEQDYFVKLPCLYNIQWHRVLPQLSDIQRIDCLSDHQILSNGIPT